MQPKLYPTTSQIREIYDRVMADTEETRRIIAERRKREATNRPTIGPVVAHAGSGQQPQFQYATNELVAQVQTERHAREKVEAQARERVEANAEIMRTFNAKGRQPASEPQTLEEAQSVLMAKFTTPKPAALAIRAIKE